MLTWLAEPQFLSGPIMVPVKVNGTAFNALVDTGATSLVLTEDLVRRLGLRPTGSQRMRTSAGIVSFPWIEKLEIEVLGRKMISDAVVKAGGTALLGQKQLEGLDLIVLPRRGEVRHNTLGAVPTPSEWFTSGCSPTPRARWLPSGLIEIEGEGTPSKKLPDAVKQWPSIIRSAAAKHGLPPQLIAGFMAAESGGDKNARSFCCYGLMGLLPQTASSQAGRTVTAAELISNPALNVDLGSKLIATLMTKYNGNVVKTAGAYNAGSPRCGAGRCSTPNRWNLVADCVQGVAFDYQTRVISFSNAAVSELGAQPTLPASTVTRAASPLGLLALGAALVGALAIWRGAGLAANPLQSNDLDVYLAPPGKVPGIGPERGKAKQNGIAKFVSPHGSHRYVFYKNGEAIAGLQIVSRDKKVGTVANVYVRPEFRRRGLATILLHRAKQDFQRIEHAEPAHRSIDAEAWIRGIQ